jgi:hypothetical protein
LAPGNRTLTRDTTKCEDDDRCENAEHDNDDQEFNQGKATLNLSPVVQKSQSQKRLKHCSFPSCEEAVTIGVTPAGAPNVIGVLR